MELPNVPLQNGQPAFEPLAWRYRRLSCQLITGLMWLSVLGVLMSFSMPTVRPHRATFLMIGTVCYLSVALLGGALRWNYGRLMFLGLICCALGDYLGLRNFVWGALAFLVAHFFFVAAFWVIGIDWQRALRLVPIMLVVGIAILAWLLPGISSRSDMFLVLGYMVVISLMVILAYGISSEQHRPLILLAAVIFFVSDIFVARWRFTPSGSINGYFCYPMYYTACVLFAWTTCLYYQRRESLEPPLAA